MNGGGQTNKTIFALSAVVIFAIVVAGKGGMANAQYRLEQVAAGLNRPLNVALAPGDETGLYVIEQFHSSNASVVSRVDSLTGIVTPFLDVPDVNPSDSDTGAFSISFHPDYETNGKFYVGGLFEDAGQQFNRLIEYQLDLAGDPQISRTMLSVPHLPGSGGHSLFWTGFDPTATGPERSYLYVTIGDGGIQAGNPSFVNNPQDLTSMLGKLIRIDVDGPDSRPGDPDRNYAFAPGPYNGDDADELAPGATLPEIYVSGIRSPFRASFDRATGDFYLGDVGFVSREEIDFLRSGGNGANGSGQGVDFGWARREGTQATALAIPGIAGPQGTSHNPILEYVHPGLPPPTMTEEGEPILGFSVTGGVVYRGPVEELQGLYFFNEFIQNGGEVYAGRFDRDTPVSAFDGNNLTEVTNWTSELHAKLTEAGISTDSIDRVTAFGEDHAGNLLFVDYGHGPGVFPEAFTGSIIRLVPDLEPLAIRVDRDADTITLLNPTDRSILLDEFTISSVLGSLDPVTLTGLSGVDPDWDRSPGADAHQIMEFNAIGVTELPPGAAISLGNGFSPVMPAQFGIDAGDLEFEYRSDGANVPGGVEYRGTAGFNNLVLVVDPVSGKALIRNASHLGVTIDGYSIDSASGSLLASWSGLEGNEQAEADWQRSAGSDQFRLTELSGLTEEVFLSERTLALGIVFDATAGTGDLVFDFLPAGEFDAFLGAVVYANLGLIGDYNADGMVSAADYIVWRNSLGQEGAGLLADGDRDFDVDVGDYRLWKQHYGESAATQVGAGDGAEVQGVPEPSPLSLAIAAMIAGVCRAGRRGFWI